MDKKKRENACRCCGRQFPVPTCKVEGGRMHFDCWEEHHGDPTGPWPPEHACELEG